MNRIALCTVLAVALVVGVIFGVHASFDLDLSALFFNRATMFFPVGGRPWEQHAREGARLLITLIALPPIIAILGKLVMPRRRMLIGGRAALFLVLTLAIGPGVVANTILKDHWGRVRPIDTLEFGGSDRFTPWWDPRGQCDNNCSFIAGEPSGAFWVLAPAAMAPPQWRLLAYGGVIAFGSALGVLRMAAGGHFFTDVVFAGIIMYLVAWSIHGLIFRWRATRLDENAIDRAFAWPGEAVLGALAALSRRLGGRRDEQS
jgi:lipid A 4'-phosphatase